MLDKLGDLEVVIVGGGLKVLGIFSFLSFFAWALIHLWRLFVSAATGESGGD